MQPQVEMENFQAQFDSIPRRGQAMHVQQQHVQKDLKKDADNFFSSVRKLDVEYFMQKRGGKQREK